VALAHHLEDQSETVLLQLLRGTGLRGAAAMPEVRALAGSRVRLLRPLLGVGRTALREHAKSQGLPWIEDESNASTRHDRNYLRHEIAPRLDARLPRWREATARFARHAAYAQRLLDALAAVDGLPSAAGDELAVDARLAPERRANLLRAFLALNGAAMPSEARLAEMARQLFDARGDARVRLAHEGTMLLRFRDRIRIEAMDSRASGDDGVPWHRPWNGEREVELAPGHGRVRFDSVAGEGLAAAKSILAGWHFAGRSGGERMRLDPRRPNRTLKNLLQENDVPVWDRGRLPLLFHAERLVWAPGVGIEADYACPAGEPGLRPVWLREG
jgi:tRNA(Ile)-lysidine synthase